MVASKRWHTVANVELDTRTADERRIEDLMLALVIGRTRPQMYGPRTAEVMRKIVTECPARLPWELEWDEDHERTSFDL
jgi:hypothetical protein